MKITHFFEEVKGKRVVKIHMVAETQKEAADLIEICNAMPKAIQTYGAVGEHETWAWITLPLISVSYKKKYFGNTEM